jgi:hypothetical protein
MLSVNSALLSGRLRYLVVIAILAGFWSSGTVAQELVPRIYWPTPKGTSVFVLGYQYSSGDVVTDPALPVADVKSRVNFLQGSYQRTLDLFGRMANLQINVPYVWGSTTGLVNDERRTRDLSAFSDARVLLSVNLLGAPSMDAQEFSALRAEPRTIVGASILIQAPTGAYDPDKLINTGANRWAVKPAVGLIWPIRRDWLLEAAAGVWFFGDNDQFLGDTRKQDPIWSTELHLVKRIRPGFWTALDVNYYSGGRTSIDRQDTGDRQRNSRIGATLVVPFLRRHAIRASFSVPLTTESGGDFDTMTLSYLRAW